MIKDNLIKPVPLLVTAVRSFEAAAEGGRAEPPVPAPGGKELPRPAVAGALETDLTTVVAALNDYVQSVKRDLQFAMDQDSGRTVITVLDTETQEIVRQIPPESAVALVSYLRNEGRLDSFGLVETA